MTATHAPADAERRSRLGAASLIEEDAPAPAADSGVEAPAPQAEKARRVRSMFASIAHAYDFNNHFLSGGVDVAWRHKTVKIALKGLATPERPEKDLAVLDVCSGTGDLAFAFRKRLGGAAANVVGSDFTLPMLEIADRKEKGRYPVAGAGDAASLDVSPFAAADATRLPFASDSFDVVSVAFGLRNVADQPAGLEEMARVARPGGRVVVLEFTQPPNALFRRVYYAYFFKLLPRLGGFFSRRRDAYAYLAQSVVEFDTCESLADKMRDAGLANVRYHRLTMGIAAIHVGEKAYVGTGE